MISSLEMITRIKSFLSVIEIQVMQLLGLPDRFNGNIDVSLLDLLAFSLDIGYKTICREAYAVNWRIF